MILAAVLAVPAVAQPVTGAVQVSRADIFGWWLPVAAPPPRPAVITLHGRDGLYLRNPLNAASAPWPSALDWLAARPDVDRNRIVVLGWSHGGNALLAALKHGMGPMPLQARAANHPRRRAR